MASISDPTAGAVFTRRFHVGWAEIDFNQHMRNTAFLDLAVDTRMLYYKENGFALQQLERLKLGPVVLRDEIEYFRELKLLDAVDVTLAIAGLSRDAARWRLRNEYFAENGKLAARLTSTGGWLNLTTRKLCVPPDPLANLLRALAKTADYAVIE
jgi:acyl-CoA thioester hydrolase